MFSNPTDIIRQCGVSAGSVVGDFGVGEGAYARVLSAHVGPGGVVYAFDVQKDLISRLSREVEGVKDNVIHPVWVDLEMPRGTTLSDGVLDLALSANVLFQVDDKDAFVREIARVLRPGGYAVHASSFGSATPFWTPEAVLRRGFRRRGLTEVES
ncbi:MAG TPA: class I SAM-dependent methyltransferase, partial [Candidatus Paceibacterota bacterium]|nr:class I SAM-dependent methyltransferase [Candidatus Paceibacterota bacterium]